MPFIPKDWRDSSQDLTTPITAAALEDMEARLAAYTDAEVEPERASVTSLGVSRSVQSDFRSAEFDSALFDFSNTSRTTDPAGRPCIRPTAAHSQVWSMFSKEMFGDVDVFIRYRPANDDTTSTTDYGPSIFLKYLGADNLWKVTQYHAVGNPNISGAQHTNANVQSVGAAVNAASPLSTAVDRCVRVQSVQDVLRYKTWASNAIEPDWMVSQRVRVTNQTTDVVPFGKVGIGGQFFGGYVVEFSAVELVRVDDNLLWSPGVMGRDTSSVPQGDVPAFWEKDLTTIVGSNVVYSEEQVEDPYGFTRSALKIVKTGAGTAMWTQNLYNALAPGRTAFDADRGTARWPRVPFPETGWCEFSFWAKAEDIVKVSPTTLTFVYVAYAYDRTGTVLAVGENQDEPGGIHTYGNVTTPEPTGDLDWTLVKTRFRIPKPYAAQLLRMQFGFHDDNTNGTCWILDPVLRPSG